MTKPGNNLYVLKSFLIILISLNLAMGDFCMFECNELSCRPPHGCEVGTVKDECGCCDVCANPEGFFCDPVEESYMDQPRMFGKCGEELVCAPDPMCPHDQRADYICICAEQEPLCGTDGHIYMNICEMRQTNVKTGGNIGVLHYGPCETAPVILNGPKDIRNYTETSIVLSCHIMGYPLPKVDWMKRFAPGYLPGNDKHCAMQARGGPGKFELTSWIQIEGLKPDHEGEYVCMASNEIGAVEKSGYVSVIGADVVNDPWAAMIDHRELDPLLPAPHHVPIKTPPLNPPTEESVKLETRAPFVEPTKRVTSAKTTTTTTTTTTTRPAKTTTNVAHDVDTTTTTPPPTTTTTPPPPPPPTTPPPTTTPPPPPTTTTPPPTPTQTPTVPSTESVTEDDDYVFDPALWNWWGR